MDNKETKSPKEFDVDQYLVSSIQSIVSACRTVLNYVKILFKRPITLALIVFGGLLFGWLLSYVLPSFYEVNMTLEVTAVNNEVSYELIQNLNTLVKNSSAEFAAQKLAADPMVLEDVFSIEMENMLSNIDIEDSIVNGAPFRIRAILWNQDRVESLQALIVNYLESNPYSLKRKNLELNRTENLVNKIILEQKEVDSLKNIAASSLLIRGQGTGLIYGQPLDPINIYREAITLFQRQQELEIRKVLIDNVQVVTGFEASEKPTFPNKGIIILIGCFLVFLIYWVILIRKSR